MRRDSSSPTRRTCPCTWAPWASPCRKSCAGAAATCSRAMHLRLNAPYAGGTHLPDVTVVMPVFLGAARTRVLRRGARSSRRHRRHHAGLDAVGLEDHRRRRRAHRQRAHRRARRVPRGEALRVAAHERPLSGAQRHAESRRPARADRRLPERHRGTGGDDGALRPRRGAGLHAARAGQCRGRGTESHRCAEGRRIHLRDGQRRGGARRDPHRPRSGAKPPSTSPAPARSRPTTSTRRCR